MGFQDVAFLPSRASFPPHLLEIVVKKIGTTTYLKTVVG